MKTKYAVLSSLFFIIQLVGVLPLRAEHYYFKQISLKEGLPSNVRCILRTAPQCSGKKCRRVETISKKMKHEVKKC